MSHNKEDAYLPLTGGTMTGILTLSGDPIGDNDAANKSYVDAISAGLTFKTAVTCATTANLNATYLNGALGVGATLVNAGALVAFTVDGITPTINQRVLVKNQTTTFQNGIYTITTLGTGVIAWILTRATDYDQAAEINPGDIVPVSTGTTQANTSWLQTAFVTTMGTSAITFQQYQSTPIQTTQYDVLVGGASNTVVSVGPGSVGQVLQSSGNASNPAYSTATYPSTTTINQILYSSSSNTVAGITAANNGTLISGATGVPSLLANGTTGQILTATTGSPPSWAPPASSGTVTSVSGTANQVAVANGTTTPVISLIGPYTPATYTAHGVLIGEATSSITALAAGSPGQVLQSGGSSADPAYSTPTYPSTSGSTGKILISDGTNNIYSTPTYPNTASTALKHIKSDGTNFVTTTVTYPDASVTAGKVIVSDGTNYIASTPTFPNASATTRKMTVSDGTNWVASTETWATPSTSGNVLTSDGTNWTSAAAPAGNVLIASVTLTNSQIKALHATPIQIIAAPGSGKSIYVVGLTAKLVYGGTNVFTAAASQAIGLYYNNNTTAINVGTTFITNSMIVSSANKFTLKTSGASSSNQVAGVLDNVNVAAYQDGSATEITGNAGNDNTINIQVAYYILTF